MRDFRNAKSMAKSLTEALAERSLQISHSESLELIARILGCRNWQTLSAAIEAGGGRPVPAALPAAEAFAGGLLPLVPMRDVVVFPEMTIPIFAGRPKTLRAVEHAMTGDRRLFLVTQRRDTAEAPAADDLFEVGVIALILQVRRLPDGSMKLTVQGERRARLARLKDGDLLEAEVEAIEPGPSTEAAQALAREALVRFGQFANFDPSSPPIAMARIGVMAAHPGLLADLMTPQVATRLDQAQDLLETVEPEARLHRLISLMSEARKAA